MKSCLLSAMLGILFSCTLVHAGSGITIIGGLTRYASLKPGGQAEGRILVQNLGTEPQEVKAFLTDYLFFADGRNLYDPPGTHPRSNAAWVTFTPSQFIVPAQDTVIINYVLQVPPEEKLTGTYWSMLMVEPITTALDAPAAEKDKLKLSVQTVLRYGIQLIADIDGTGASSVRFVRQQLVKQNDKCLLVLDIENNGERYLTPLVWAEIFDSEGASLGRFEAGRIRVYPACSARFLIDLTQLSTGKYSALVVADNGDEAVFGAQLKLEIP